ncbi:hypothetical protein [Geodermatophilus sp. CPCC 205761]|uniref:hypothetical protein n=1 Tax=Geodermatophilus sp. CPCC 205761 TaxID=2936597 RepID=UPI003EE8ECAB
MDPRLLAAIIAGVTSVLVTVITVFVTLRQGTQGRRIQKQIADRQVQAQESIAEQQVQVQKGIAEAETRAQRDLEQFKQDLKAAAETSERLRTVEEERDRYWASLLDAADDLYHRIRNIRQRGFLVYFSGSQPRRRVAQQSTFYRFARYWGAAENVNEAQARLGLERDNPRALAVAAEIGQTFTTDSLGHQFMVWREEQRAIGELMRRGVGEASLDPLLGFASFVRRYDEDFEVWFASMSADLDAPQAAGNQRLAALQTLLAELVRELRRDLDAADEAQQPVASAADMP